MGLIRAERVVGMPVLGEMEEMEGMGLRAQVVAVAEEEGVCRLGRRRVGAVEELVQTSLTELQVSPRPIIAIRPVRYRDS